MRKYAFSYCSINLFQSVVGYLGMHADQYTNFMLQSLTKYKQKHIAKNKLYENIVFEIHRKL